MNDTAPEKTKLSWWQRLTGGLKRTSNSLGTAVADLVTKRKLDRAMLEDIEDVLLRADLGTEVAARIERCWRPYHAAVAEAIADAHARNGFSIHVNCHSMPAVAGSHATEHPGLLHADFVLGDRDGVVIVPRTDLADIVAKLDGIRRAEEETQNKIRAGLAREDLADDPAFRERAEGITGRSLHAIADAVLGAADRELALLLGRGGA